MQDLRKNKRKVMNKPMNMVNNHETEEIKDELTRVYRPKHNSNDCSNPCQDSCNNPCNKECISDCGCEHYYDHEHHYHEHHHHDKCEPAEIESDICVDNPCSETCCSPIAPAKFSTSNSVPVAIEANRVYDSVVFQALTDGRAPEGTLVYDIEVVEVFGPVPRSGPVNITIEKVCMNYCSIEIVSENPKLEDFNVVRISPKEEVCDTTFEYAVCGDRNSTCCAKGKGQSVAYKQKGLVVVVKDLVLELRGRCGCTEVVALAYPAVKTSGGCIKRICEVEFPYNTLASTCCLPSSGRTVTLRQDYQVSLTVDCIGKATLCLVEVSECECYYNLDIPNGIDVILCLQEVVSILVSEQIVVLASPTFVQPRVVDTFAKVCDFTLTDCKENTTANTNECNTLKKGCNTCN